MYLYGYDTPRDLKEAHNYFKAASDIHPKASFWLGGVSQYGTPQTDLEAYDVYLKSIKEVSPRLKKIQAEAYYQLARLLKKGVEVEKDKNKHLNMFTKMRSFI